MQLCKRLPPPTVKNGTVELLKDVLRQYLRNNNIDPTTALEFKVNEYSYTTSTMRGREVTEEDTPVRDVIIELFKDMNINRKYNITRYTDHTGDGWDVKFSTDTV